MKELINIANVLIHHGEPPDGNPFRGLRPSRYHEADPITSVGCGEPRVVALQKFRDGQDIGDLTFWRDGNYDGRSRRIVSRDEIDWEGMRE